MVDYCTDREANLNGMSLSDALTPCPQLAATVPVVVVVQMCLFLVFAWLRRLAMKKMGLEDDDIEAIFSSRQLQKACEAPEEEVSKQPDIDIEAIANTDEEDVEANTSGDAKSSSDESTENTSKNGSDSDSKSDSSNSVPQPEFDLPTLMEKYGDKKLRILDSIPRKSVHFLVLLMTTLALEFTTDTFVAQGQTACVAALSTFLILLVFLSFAPDARLTSLLYGWAARVRDGRVARKNLLVAICAVFIGTTTTYLIGSQGIVSHLQDPALQKLMLNLYFAPLAVGDAMGELIGSPFGGMFFNTFRVQGFGEINRKSIEGCFAVFVGSLVSTILISLYYGAITSSWMILCLLLSVVTTFVETASFRSTDNFFIPLFNCVVVLLALGPFGDKFHQV